ncbi:hypothetical protein pb186bvf_019666 [Paramecium bursaria]
MAQQFQDVDHLFKVILLGDTSVGKSQILQRFTRNMFIDHSSATVGVEFSAKPMEILNKKIKLQVWDTAGQEKFKGIARAYYKGAVGALMIYDITDSTSFQSIKRWQDEVQQHAKENIVLMLVGNKCDLEQNRKVTKKESIEFAQANKMGFLETSAKTGQNIDFAFQQLAEELLRNIDVKQEDEFKNIPRGNQRLSVVAKPQDKKDGSCC